MKLAWAERSSISVSSRPSWSRSTTVVAAARGTAGGPAVATTGPREGDGYDVAGGFEEVTAE
jgi:hypothetical protein